MRTSALQSTLKALARHERWCTSESTLRAFHAEPLNTFRVAMKRHVRAGWIVRLAPGLYLNPLAPKPPWALEKLAAHLRPQDFYYVSLESALNEHGQMSQIPSRLTLMTSGRSYTHNTPLGTIEFVHTDRAPATWRSRTTFIAERGIHVASAQLALDDLRRVGRNLDLVERD